MSGVQLPIGIETVNPVDADYKRGPWATIAAALAGINILVRYNNLSFYVIGDPNEYYWLDTNLTDGGLLIRSSGGSNLPKVRYVYLVQDASDAVLMGGVTSNVYTTFQTAYNAANTLQVLLGGTNKVVIQVGNTTALTVGDLTLTANWNNNVELIGLSTRASQVGNIIANNAVGNGFNIGIFLGSNKFRAFNLTIGNITTNATGATGNSGIISAVIQNVVIGNIDTSITNVLNITGNGGNITFQTVAQQFCQNFFISNITTSSQATSTNAGNVSISGQNFSITSLTTCNNNGSGGINIQSNTASGGRITTINHNCTNNGGAVNITKCVGLTWNFNFLIATSGLNQISQSTITNLSILSSVVLAFSIHNNIIGLYTSNSNIQSIARQTLFERIVDLGLNSILMLCSLAEITGGVPAINGISAGCRIINCTIEGGSFGIDNLVPVSVDVNINSTYIQNAVGANITLI